MAAKAFLRLSELFLCSQSHSATRSCWTSQRSLLKLRRVYDRFANEVQALADDTQAPGRLNIPAALTSAHGEV
jgi:hypothetical protein